jgi:cation transporter-like permease
MGGVSSLRSTAMKSLFDSTVRTIVPIIVGAVIGWAVTQGITLDDQFEVALTLTITGAFQGIYYLVVRLFETYVSPKFGWLLGLAKKPVYVEPVK